MVAQIFPSFKGPFDPALLEHNEAELDFILEMESINHPDRISFSRQGDVVVTDVKVAWDNVLRGPAKEDYYGKSLMDAIKRATAKLSKQPRLGVVRGKKP